MSRISLISLTTLLCVPVLLGGSWADRVEYDLVLQLRGEPRPEKRLELLKRWSDQYPASAFSHLRQELLLASFQSVGDSESMLRVAREMIKASPNDFIGLYWTCALVPQSKDQGPQ